MSAQSQPLEGARVFTIALQHAHLGMVLGVPLIRALAKTLGLDGPTQQKPRVTRLSTSTRWDS